MRGQELVDTKSCPQASEPGEAFAGVIDDGDARAEVWDIAVDRFDRTQFPNVADGALSTGHEDATGAVQVVPLGFVFAVAVKYLNAVVFPVGDIDPSVGVAGDVVRDVELA